MPGALKQEIDQCFEDAIGAAGLARADFDRLVAATEPALRQIAAWRAQRPFLSLPDRRDDLASLRATAEAWRADYDRLVVLGTGGSSLGGRALAVLGPHGDRVSFLDNGNGEELDAILSDSGRARTGFLVVSKSGGTAETLAQAMIALEACAPAQFTALVQPGDSALRRLAAHTGIAVLEHDPNLGGRFSVLSAVGLLPAFYAGVDGARVRDGARAVLDAALGTESPPASAPALGAALAVGLARQNGIATTVFMPYTGRFHALGLWYRQLWAESLGKEGVGTNPVVALGPVDQHSQLQLYLDGPNDKLFTILTAPDAAERRVPAALAREIGVDYLAGRRIGDLVAAQARATAETLARAGRPVRALAVDAADAAAVGALMMHLMLETVIAAHLLGVDPFDQPAVEQGKTLARDYLARAP